LGGYSSERHISVESGRNVFEKLNSSGEFEASPIFLLDNSQVPEPLRVQLAIPHHEPFSFWEIPISYLLKDNADDIADKIVKAAQGLPVPQTLRRIWQSAAPLRSRYVASPLTQPARLTLNELANRFQFVFLGLHGRPGEDGQVQALLQQAGIAYNGSTPASAALTIDKYATNQLLRQHGIAVANHRLVHKTEWMQNPAGVTAELEQGLGFPLIAKPQDDGCSSAVQRIDTPKELAAYCKAIFREQGSGVDPQTQSVLGLKPNEEFPAKATALFENLISPPAGWRQIEVTVGFVTHTDPEGNVQVEVLEPSEALAAGKVLTLEEKFLAGEGQNITPARLSPDPALQAALTHKLKTAIATTARTVGAHGYGRIDAFVQISPAGECRVVIIEVNSLPGMTPATCIFHQAAENGYTPHQFIATIITEGKRKSFIMP
jgi:D-alanine-D-alanine ligase